MGKALYRKYRPISLDSVIGQDTIIKSLKEEINSDNISHAYIFTGPRGCGKTSVARIFAHEINHFKYELEDSYVDIIEIDGASNTGIDNIRDLREKAMIAPNEGKYKIYIIDEFHMLSKSAFNALLKIMEEPPEHVVFILATTNLEKVPVTITSRAQVFTFCLADAETMKKHISKIAKSEGIIIEDAAIDIIVRRGGGSFRDTISLLDQISSLKPKGETITNDDVDKALGLPTDEKIKSLLSNYEGGNTDETTSILKELLNLGTATETIAADIIERIIENPTPKTLNLISRLFDVSYPFAEAKLLVAFLDTRQAQVAPQPQVQLASARPAARPVSSQPDPSQAAAKPQATSNDKFDAIRERLKKSAELAKIRNKKPEETKPEVNIEAASLTDSVIQSGELNLTAFVGSIKSINYGLGSFIENASFKIEEDLLKIYPARKTDYDILRSQKNMEVIKESAPGYRVEIVNINDEDVPDDAISISKTPRPKISSEMKQKIAALSDIMGEGIQTADDDPFKER